MQLSQAGNYRVVVVNSSTSVTSAPATLIVLAPTAPVIVTQPQSQTLPEGQPFLLSVTATNALPLSYQWQRNGTNLPLATASVFGVAKASPSDSGSYSVVVSNQFLSTQSAPALVTVTSTVPVNPGPPGSVDLAYEAATDAPVDALSLQSDGKLLLAGVFYAVNGTARNQFARLHSDGTLDAAFDPPLARPGYGPHDITALVLQPDERILIAGIPAAPAAFGGGGHYVARFTSAGQFDPSFTTHVQTNAGYIWSQDVALGLQTDGRIVLATETYVQPQPMHCWLSGLLSDGLPDPDFPFPFHIGSWGGSHPGCFASQADGKLLLGHGDGMIRLNLDSSLDATFQFAPELDSIEFAVSSIAVQPDARILITGTRTARLQPNGSLDNSFEQSLGGSKIVMQSDGQILVAGGTITRLNPDGSVDPSFLAATVTGNVSDLVLLADGRIVVGGSFSQVNGVPRRNLSALFVGSSAPSILVNDPTFGIKTNGFGFTISWTSGKVVVVEAVTEVISPTWSSLSTNTLVNGTSFFIDAHWTNYPTRFYRVRSK